MRKIYVIILAAILLFGLFACSKGGESKEQNGEVYQPVKLYARYLTNTPGENVTLSSGRGATADSTLFFTQEISSGKKLTPPASIPSRDGYKFAGWATSADGQTLFDFDAAVYGGVTLYAKWERDEEEKGETYVEPTLKFVEQKDESAPFILKSVLTAPVENGRVNLPRASIRILTENANNVKELLGYTVNSSTSIRSAIFASNKITVTYNSGAGDMTETVSVSDISASLSVESTYETKAAKYEENVAIAPYSVMMGGSSSMENWSTSVEDMKPVTTANVGIGGTTVEHWSEKLCERLIYPFNPRAVIFYVGINNIINAGKSGSQTGTALITLFDNVHGRLPNAQVYFIMINKVPGYTSYYGDIDVANEMVIAYSANKSYMTLIDAGAGLVKESGKTNSAYFLTDGLHMSLCGYVIWGGAVKQAFIANDKDIYG
ncbi:MAG: InlB B-repeat-containing protein [Clostridia bacterium]|nr:InlB B-repeat-containing protein [Clostridia bacterium]